MSGSGAAGNKTTVITSVTPPPISAPDSRSGPVAVPATAIIKMAEVADWLTNSTPRAKNPPPTASAATSAIAAATPMAIAPEPLGVEPPTALTAVPMPIPSTTPTISCRARCPRSTLFLDSDTAAAVGAKNGW